MLTTTQIDRCMKRAKIASRRDGIAYAVMVDEGWPFYAWVITEDDLDAGLADGRYWESEIYEIVEL